MSPTVIINLDCELDWFEKCPEISKAHFWLGPGGPWDPGPFLSALIPCALFPSHYELSSFALCHDVPSLEPDYHGLKPMKPWSTLNLTSLRLLVLRILLHQCESQPSIQRQNLFGFPQHLMGEGRKGREGTDGTEGRTQPYVSQVLLPSISTHSFSCIHYSNVLSLTSKNENKFTIGLS